MPYKSTVSEAELAEQVGKLKELVAEARDDLLASATDAKRAFLRVAARVEELSVELVVVAEKPKRRRPLSDKE